LIENAYSQRQNGGFEDLTPYWGAIGYSEIPEGASILE